MAPVGGDVAGDDRDDSGVIRTPLLPKAKVGIWRKIASLTVCAQPKVWCKCLLPETAPGQTEHSPLLPGLGFGSEFSLRARESGSAGFSACHSDQQTTALASVVPTFPKSGEKRGTLGCGG
jgi:hypothetical protein